MAKGGKKRQTFSWQWQRRCRFQQPDPADVVRWLAVHDIKTLNVSGNSEKEAPGIGKTVECFLGKVLKLATNPT